MESHLTTTLQILTSPSSPGVHIVSMSHSQYLPGPRLAGLYGCPICGQGLTPSDLETHLEHELELLAKISIISPDLIHHKFAMSPGLDQAPRNRWDVSKIFLMG